MELRKTRSRLDENLDDQSGTDAFPYIDLMCTVVLSVCTGQIHCPELFIHLVALSMS